MKINAERIGGFKEPIDIQVEGLPEGVKANPLKLAAGQNAGDLTLVADGAASIDARSVRIVGVAKDRKATATWAGAAEVDAILLAVALPTPIVIKGEYDMGFAPRGAVHQRKYKIERNGFDGPIEISLADRRPAICKA